MGGLLDGITVLDLSTFGPAPRAAGWLADYGADVVKVGPPPSGAAPDVPARRHAYSGGRGTRRIRVDLKSAAGRDAFLRVAAGADVLIESFRPGVVDRLGIGYADVKRVNPRIIYCSTTGYGQSGERSGWAGHDLNYLAVSGYLDGCERDGDGKPPVPGTTIADGAGGGMHAAIAILAALFARTRTGEGAYLDVSVAEGMLALMALQVDDALVTGDEQEPGGAPLYGRFACYDTYRAGDGGWLAVAAVERRFWANLCTHLDLPGCVDAQYDRARQQEVRSKVAAKFATKTRDEWVALLCGADTCVSPVLTASEAAHDPAFAARGAFAKALPAHGDPWLQLASLLAGTERVSGYDVPDDSASDTEAVLAGSGISAAEIDQLRAAGAVA
jgi:alpha-methylacyl-CoA racemase